jgi:thiamine biosynthesis lipoprotein
MTDRKGISRRRVLSILAIGASLPFSGALASLSPAKPYRWQGIALGADADLTLYADTPDQAARAIDASLAELARLEAVFSLHQPDSALARLNREGRLADPPAELVELMSLALRLGRLSAGRFDPTVQPLWRTIADHFAAPGADPAGPDRAILDTAQRLVDWRQVSVDEREILLSRTGMQITLNGIAQGYISDRVGELLQDLGMRHALVNLGEALAIDRQAGEQPWRIGIPAPDDRSRLVTTIALGGGAIATSAGRGLCFEPSGRFNHIIDPTRLVCAPPDRSVSVLAPSAAVADGLSTLGALVPDPERQLASMLRELGAKGFVISHTAPEGRWLTA